MNIPRYIILLIYPDTVIYFILYILFYLSIGLINILITSREYVDT